MYSQPPPPTSPPLLVLQKALRAGGSGQGGTLRLTGAVYGKGRGAMELAREPLTQQLIYISWYPFQATLDS
jgi:hypothetical protein